MQNLLDGQVRERPFRAPGEARGTLAQLGQKDKAAGSWVAPFYVTAGVLASGSLIWIFLIDPEKSVVGSSTK